eukprot:TRINITY_DN433_c0_g1_i1.p1 TRINITY_DN433_c0_g1~~TRINITY_DN433_c0_g1_i1.p1  ORF type:complete len:448 (+),score=144.16 TRINITY_DN433_c0_g1_i1:79-1344(+)
MKRWRDGGDPAAKRARHIEDDDRNLMVNFLPEEVDEGQLRQMFEPSGEIERVKLMTDDQGRSKRFGFVRFVNADDAREAIKNLHGLELNGKRLRVAYAHNTSGSRESGGPKLYMSGFGTQFTAEQLEALCSEYGTVRQVKVLPIEEHPKGVGFVTFDTQAEAENCKNKLDNLEFEVAGKKDCLTVRWAKAAPDEPSKGAGGGGARAAPFDSVFPRGQDQFQMQQQMLMMQLQQMAQLHALLGQGMGVMLNPMMGMMPQAPQPGMGAAPGMGMAAPGGFGAVGALPPMPAIGAMPPIPAMQGMPPMGAIPGMPPMGAMGAPGMLAIQGAPSGGDGSDICLFCRGFTEASEALARQIFSQFGVVTKVDIPRDPVTQRARNYCFVHMQDVTAAQAACAALDNSTLPGSDRTLQVSFRRAGPGPK